MEHILDCLTRGLDLEILTRGYGQESRGVIVSYQAQSPVLGAVLPSNSPGVHTLWLPAIPLQFGLVLKPGPQEPWTPYRMVAAFIEAGIPSEVFASVSRRSGSGSGRALGFAAGDDLRRTADGRTVPRQSTRASARPRLLQDPARRRRGRPWEEYLDLMVESIYLNSGRGCINCSGIWASRHTREIAQALGGTIGAD